jgi:hydroxyacylglutathione hydrolase
MGLDAYIMHTPGHTSGSVSVIVDDEIALVGDAMFGVFKGSVFPPYAENADEMVRSWGKLLGSHCRIFIPSHGTANNRSLVEKEFRKRIPSV